MRRTETDPYKLDVSAVRNPPRTLAGAIRHVGPGLILAATVVGSGELVATTVLGAETGYMLLWLILVSCAVKIVVQHEMGRFTIGTGATALEALNKVPGPRARVGWVVWLWLIMACSLLFSTGGMFGAIAEVMHMVAPAVPVDVWVPMVGIVTFCLLYFGRYGLIEKASLILVGMLTFMTVAGMLLLLKRPDLFAWSDAADGLRFRLPSGGLSTALTVFGATGMGAAEMTSYPYWCIEKGYARFTGPNDGSKAWLTRARGWVRVMGLDVILSLFVYTFSTVAFFLLGAGVLHGLQTVPEGADTIRTLSAMYSETLGPWSMPVFLAGAVAVLYSTIFGLTAAYSRIIADFLGLAGFFDRKDFEQRTRFVHGSMIAFLIGPCITFYFIREPVVMLKIGGITQAVLLPILGFSTLHLLRRHLPAAIAPSRNLRLALWVTSSVMAVLVLGAVYLQLSG